MANAKNYRPVEEGGSLWTISKPSPWLLPQRKQMDSLIRQETIMANTNRKKELDLKKNGKGNLKAESYPALLREDLPAYPIYRRPRYRRFEDMSLEEMFEFARYFRRSKRSQDDIARSGAYQLETCAPIPRGMDREKEKDRLAKIMTYGTEEAEELLQPYKPTNNESYNSSTTNTSSAQVDEFEELIEEIEEREQFLHQMHQIGLDKETQQRVTAEVIEILVKLKNLDPVRYEALSNDYR
ncbi:UPF0193 protein EVG1-like [Paramacrobiotus metropolitanus]|uniref:UPF0193 protein EVG1-like n=1 Tax=Paramacrobiotus metropolitanus TaxID=2943436 RepID=UPI0024464F3D|nr:UPF0193 protein EVG1-like [Paramacrobiotus metropolitanus]